MVLEYLPTFARTKSPSHVGKYTSTMDHLGDEVEAILQLDLSKVGLEDFADPNHSIRSARCTEGLAGRELLLGVG
jgi:hypothetical protein